MIHEIGSEFWKENTILTSNIDASNTMRSLLSGRTALDYIIRDTITERKIDTALLPSYCCESMIEPFIRNGINVIFYQINSDEIEFPILEYDAVLLLDYFGYETAITEEIVQKAHSAGKIVIYDSTHKLNGNPEVEAYSDYSIISYRKWFYCNYARAIKHTEAFTIPQPEKVNQRYIDMRECAAVLKANYINSGSVALKQKFLQLYSSAKDILDRDYTGYAGQPVKTDICKIITTRRQNALYLINELSDVPEVRLWRNFLQSNDTPLFVPILVAPVVRDNLKRYLIEHSIYCPAHWPISNLHKIDTVTKQFYDSELSLICDQRYGIDDMQKEIELVKSFLAR